MPEAVPGLTFFMVRRLWLIVGLALWNNRDMCLCLQGGEIEWIARDDIEYWISMRICLCPPA